MEYRHGYENFEETKIFIHRADEFASTRAWLLTFIDGFERQDKATMLATVQNAQSQFVAAMSGNVQ
ncbi:MAG: hypothetical protein NPIRA04_22600 [Nitrospirales bacterium]|nr:MAG: hypothetical protein NPIRA04_22600 [Nitrospirales bacterium]